MPKPRQFQDSGADCQVRNLGRQVAALVFDLLASINLLRQIQATWPQTGDVVFSYETRLGEAASISSGLRCCLGRRMGLLRARDRKVDKRFLLYAYLGPQFQEILRSRTIHESTVDRIPLIDMPNFPIAVPESLDDQRTIAHILGTLDDKIELKRWRRWRERFSRIGSWTSARPEPRWKAAHPISLPTFGHYFRIRWMKKTSQPDGAFLR